jgi:hypothetical protein
MLATLHGPIEQCSPFNGPNIEICKLLLEVGRKKKAFEMQSLNTTYGMGDKRYVCYLNNMYVPEPFRMWCTY